MAVIATGDLKILPRSIADGMVKGVQTGSTVAALSNARPMRFGNEEVITFNSFPRAEFVAEGAEKASTTGGFDVVTSTPKKAQVTMRFNEEVQWADEDHQLGVLSALADAGRVALARALDLGVYYRINPLTGTEITGWTNYLNSTTKRVEAGSNQDAEVEAAAGLLIGDGKAVNGLALDPSYAWKLATARYADGRKKYPDLGYGVDVTQFEGLESSVSNTVSGRPESTTPAINNMKAIIGDFDNSLRWGVQRDIPVELIKFGDPDGQGDLKRRNQIALRLEIVYGWYVFPEAFAVVEEQDANLP